MAIVLKMNIRELYYPENDGMGMQHSSHVFIS